jgi:ribosomal protein S27E
MTGDPRDYKLDISSLSGSEQESPSQAGRPFLSVHFACCGVYQRIYRDPSAPVYRGRCPKCTKTVTFPVGHGGTTSRFFRVT